jgi:hypothetical protein
MFEIPRYLPLFSFKVNPAMIKFRVIQFTPFQYVQEAQVCALFSPSPTESSEVLGIACFSQGIVVKFSIKVPLFDPSLICRPGPSASLPSRMFANSLI